MKPLWKIRSGRFFGWRAEDDELYAAGGAHLGYFVKGIAYLNGGRAIGEAHDGQWLGKHETVVYPTGTRQAARHSRAAEGLADRPGMALAGWTDPEL